MFMNEYIKLNLNIWKYPTTIYIYYTNFNCSNLVYNKLKNSISDATNNLLYLIDRTHFIETKHISFNNLNSWTFYQFITSLYL